MKGRRKKGVKEMQEEVRSDLLANLCRVCLTGKKRKGGGVSLWQPAQQDQLMAADDGAQRGQGSEPCIVSLEPLSRGVPSLCQPPASIHLLLPPAHLHTFINIVRCGRHGREGGCAACITGLLPLQSTPLLQLMRCSQSHICKNSPLSSLTGA